MTQAETPAAATSEHLESRWMRTVSRQMNANLPGWRGLAESNEKILNWLRTQEERITAAIRDCDEVLYEQAEGAWLKAVYRVNELIAEEYRLAMKDPAYWDLRYVRWMVKVVYIRFESPRGEFVVYPRRPVKRPSVPNWYTVDEVIDMLHPTAAAAIRLSDKLPLRPEVLRKKPPPGEKHLHVHVDDGQVAFRFECGEVPNAGEGVR